MGVTSAPLWQHIVAVALALSALGWLLWRSLRGKRGKADSGGSGPCSHCPARKGGPIEEAVLLRKQPAPREQA